MFFYLCSFFVFISSRFFCDFVSVGVGFVVLVVMLGDLLEVFFGIFGVFEVYLFGNFVLVGVGVGFYVVEYGFDEFVFGRGEISS